MRVALIAIDKPDSLQLRQDTRSDHVAYLKSSNAVEQAGPFLNDAGDMIGSLIILSVDEMADAQNWANNDPYAKAGLFASVTLQNWNRVIG
jgi:uncharacterized protein YciI